MKSKFEKAQAVRRKYRKILTDLKWRIQLWKNKEDLHKDSLAQMQAMTNEDAELRALGYRTSDENDKGPAGRVVLITKQWIKENRRRQDASIRNLFSSFPEDVRASLIENMEKSLGRKIN